MHTLRHPLGRPRLAGLLSALLLLLTLGGPLAVRAQEAIPLQPVEDPSYGLTTVVPEGWTNIGQGIRARRPDASDHVLLAVQSAPLPVDQLWASLLPQLGLSAAPDPIGTRTTDALEWTLYQVDVAAAFGEVRVDLAAANADGTTYLVLLQSPVEGADTLRELVFLPAVDALRPLAPEPTPDPDSLPYDVEHVTFPGGAPDVTLAGTFTAPRTDGPHPAIVLFTGSGPQDRDETLRPVAAIKPFAILADALTRAGIAVLRYDDRGTNESTGDYAAAGLADLTADAAAALAYLRARPDVDPARTGALGHSEGGVMLASLIEAGEPLAFAVGMASPATSGLEVLVAQNGALLRSGGESEEEIAQAETFARALYTAAVAGDASGMAAAIEAYFGAYWDRQPAETRAALGERAAFVANQVTRQIAAVTTPTFLDLLRSDAGVGWSMATMPVLGVFGGKDTQVVADQNAPLMQDGIDGRDPSSRVVTLPDANHLFQSAGTGNPTEYGSLEQTFTRDLLPLVVGWVAERVGLPVPGASPGG